MYARARRQDITSTLRLCSVKPNAHQGAKLFDQAYFLAFCIEQYKVAKGMDGADVARLFFENGVASYLSDNFEALHTQSRQWLIEEIDDMLQQSNSKEK